MDIPLSSLALRFIVSLFLASSTSAEILSTSIFSSSSGNLWSFDSFSGELIAGGGRCGIVWARAPGNCIANIGGGGGEVKFSREQLAS